jgi:hypothetical protein
VIDRPRPLDGLPLHLEINGRVPIRRGHTGVTKPLTDGDDVDTRSEEVGADPSPASRRRTFACPLGTQPPAAPIAQRSIRTSRSRHVHARPSAAFPTNCLRASRSLPPPPCAASPYNSGGLPCR